MRETELLNLLENALRAMNHPEVTDVRQFTHPGQAGVRVYFSDGSTCLATSYGGPTSEGATRAR